MSPSDTSLVEEEGANEDRVDQDGGAANPDCLDLNYASLCLTVA